MTQLTTLPELILINPPVETHARLWYPLGIGYIAAYLRTAGFEVKVIDLIGEDLTRAAFIRRLKGVSAKYFGIGGMITAFNNVIDIAQYIREVHPESFIFAGNTVAYTIPEVILKNSEIDVVVLGEGEITTRDLLLAHIENRSLSDVDGIAYLCPEGEVATTKQRAAIPDIDSLPFPAWDLLPIEKYFSNAGHRYCVVSTVRGCPFNCTFCCKTFMNYKTRWRKAEQIMDELLTFNEKYRISAFYFFDDLSMVYKENLIRFCTLKLNSPLAAMPWTISGRVSLIDDDIARALKEAGVTDVGFGIESLDQEVLDSYKKNVNVEQIHSAIDLCTKYRLNYSGSSFLIGATNESRKSVEASATFCREHNLRYEPHFVTPFPGTELYDYACINGLIQDELKYLRNLSTQGNTNYLLVNLTKDLSDDELIQLRAENLFFSSQTVKPTLIEVIQRGLQSLHNPTLFLERLKQLVISKLRPYRGSFERHGNTWL